MTRREFVMRHLDSGMPDMDIWRATEKQFGHCGWLYVLRIKREWKALQTVKTGDEK